MSVLFLVFWHAGFWQSRNPDFHVLHARSTFSLMVMSAADDSNALTVTTGGVQHAPFFSSKNQNCHFETKSSLHFTATHRNGGTHVHVFPRLGTT
jgi:hypothetical protein